MSLRGSALLRALLAVAALLVVAAAGHLPVSLDSGGPAGTLMPALVVTTSMLECAARELDGSGDPLRVVRLIPPGSCPGQFDLSPRLVPELRSARALLRHDYQAPLEAQLARLGVADLAVVAVRGEGSLVVPAHYLGVVRQVEAELERLFPERSGELQAGLARTGDRLAALEAEVRRRPAPWRGARVVAAVQQSELCSWLGLEVAGELPRAEDTSPRQLEALLATSPALVVGNLQEGAAAAVAFGLRLGRPVAVLSNFPGAEGYGERFDDLLRANLERLDAAWASR